MRQLVKRLIALGLALTAAGCAVSTELRTGERVRHHPTNAWANWTVHVYTPAQNPGFFSRAVWKTFAWTGSSYVCRDFCDGTESPLRNVSWPTPTAPPRMVRQRGERVAPMGGSIPLEANRSAGEVVWPPVGAPEPLGPPTVITIDPQPIRPVNAPPQ